MLNEKQQKVKDLVDLGQNIYMGGAGGVGKSFTINEIVDNGTLLCAPTGAAALNIGGVTASSLFNLPIGVALDSDKFKKAPKAEKLFANGHVKRIVLDEISMVRADHFTLIDQRLRNITKKDVPFGGVQMLFSGDFFQLSPVLTKKESKVFKEAYDSPWCFKTLAWEMAGIKSIELTEVIRQEDEKQVKMLHSIRTKDKYWQHAVQRINEISSPRPLDAIWLCNFNKTVESINKTRYKEIDGTEESFIGINKGFKPHECPVDEILRLKVGCRVLIKANDMEGSYVNGSQGWVKDFIDGAVVVELTNGDTVLVEPFEWSKYDYVVGMAGMERKKVASFKQVPIKLGWAISVHGSQGATLDSANIDVNGSFASGQSYVALSRCKDLTKLYIQGGLNYSDVIVDSTVQAFYQKLNEEN